MIKKVIPYTDFNGEQQEEVAFFNLTAAEVTEMNWSTAGGMKEHIDRIVKAKDTVAIAKEFKEILRKSYGVLSPDGKKIIKRVQDEYGHMYELFNDFEQSPAYSELYMQLATDDQIAQDFINAVLPQING